MESDSAWPIFNIGLAQLGRDCTCAPFFRTAAFETQEYFPLEKAANDGKAGQPSYVPHGMACHFKLGFRAYL